MFYICESDVWLEGDLGIKKASEIFLQELDNDDIRNIYSPYRTFLSLYLWRGLDSF
jgi:3-methyladenine DNA glycosylase/8-oxoguanine DNA glycosylase